MKSANWISATGRRPLSAIPIAIPTIPDSESGVSITLFSPNRSQSPSVARKTPPLFPMSSPRRTTAGLRSISPTNAALIAWMSVMVAIGSSLPAREELPLLGQVPRHLRIHVLHHALRGDGGSFLARFHRPLHLFPRLLRQGLRRLPVHDARPKEMLRKPPDGIPLRPIGTFLLGPVARGVVRGGVRPHPVGQRFDERRAAPGPGFFECAPGDSVYRQEIVPVHADPLEPVRGGFCCDRARGGLPRHRKGNGVLVVAAEKDGGGPVDAGEVHRRVEIARGGAPVAEVGDDRDVVPAELRGVARSHRLRQLGGDGAGHRYQVDRSVAPVVGHLVPLDRVRGVAEQLPDDGGERIAPYESCALIPVGGEKPVSVFQGEAGADLRSLLPRRRNVKADPAGPLEDDRLVVQGPQEKHLPEEEQEVLPAKPRIERRVHRPVVAQRRQQPDPHRNLPSPGFVTRFLFSFYPVFPFGPRNGTSTISHLPGSRPSGAGTRSVRPGTRVPQGSPRRAPQAAGAAGEAPPANRPRLRPVPGT